MKQLRKDLRRRLPQEQESGRIYRIVSWQEGQRYVGQHQEKEGRRERLGGE